MLFSVVLLCILLAVAAGIRIYHRRSPSTGYVPMSQYVQQRRKPQRAPAQTTKPAVQRKSYKAVSIRCGGKPCVAAKRLEGKRGFSHQIPRLPLLLCNAAQCNCTYRQHADRRGHEDRRDIYGSLYGSNRRSGDDRRQE